jgi:hypothetical protein
VDSDNGILERFVVETRDELAAIGQAETVLARNKRAQRAEVWLGPYLVKRLSKRLLQN